MTKASRWLNVGLYWSVADVRPLSSVIAALCGRAFEEASLAREYGAENLYLGQELVRLNVGPIRACYLVPDQDRGRLAEAITAASRRWGGVTEPILPVGAGGLAGEQWRRILAALAPDVFVDVGLDAGMRESVIGQLGTSVLSWLEFAGDQPGYPWLWCHPLAVEGRASDGLVPVPRDTTLRDLAGVGAVDNALTWKVHGPGILEAASELQCLLSQVSRNTVAWQTAHWVIEEAAGSVSAPPVPTVIWVSEPDSFADAAGFWNARALIATAMPVSAAAPGAILLPPDIDGWPELAEALRRHIRARYQRSRPDVFVFSHSVEAARLHEIAALLDLVEVHPPVGQEHAAPGSLDVLRDPFAPAMAAVGSDPTPWSCYPRRYGRGTSELVQVFSGPTMIRAASPVPFRLGTGGWVKVSPSGLRALSAPRRPSVARLFARDGWFTGDDFSLKRATANLYEIMLNIPELSAILTAALADAGVTFTLSDKGKYAQALLARAPGLENLVRQPGALELITDLTRRRSSRFRREVETLLGEDSDGLAERIAALARETVPLPHYSAAELPKHDLDTRVIADIVERLVALGLCSRGFSIDCAECQMESYVEQNTVTPQATCPGCGALGAYRGARDRPAGPVIRYRLNSLLDRGSSAATHPRDGVPARAGNHAPAVCPAGGATAQRRRGTGRTGPARLPGREAYRRRSEDLSRGLHRTTGEQGPVACLASRSRHLRDGRGAPTHRRPRRHGCSASRRPKVADPLLLWRHSPPNSIALSVAPRSFKELEVALVQG